MKRPPGIWILLSAGVLWLSIQDAHGIRATALIFGKSTTTAPPEPVANATDRLLDTEVVTEPNAENGGSISNSNSTKTNLTGNPQLDYIYDPNLPKELNGYNLSDYPFYERVPDPEEIDFKCDGLHDGFYASIPYKCQVYHHCLFGTRYDFLCANYTAFDQKTFICQFVSDVDCLGSKKFWHRNDALYKAATTTTLKPLNIYTTAPPPPETPINKAAVGPRAGGKRRRPIQRRPQYDFYDYADYEEDYYEDRPRSRRRRPRPRPIRPLYDDEYDEDYEEELYERRNRRPYNRRGSSSSKRNNNKNRNNKNEEVLDEEDEQTRPKDTRKKYDYDDDEEDHKINKNKPMLSEERRKPNSKVEDTDEEERPRKKNNNREENEDERPINGKRKHNNNNNRPTSVEEKRKPLRDEDFEEDYDARPSKPRKTLSRRPPLDDDYDDLPKRRENRPKKKIIVEEPESNEDKPIIKPTTGTIYDRPRVAPRIKPPVPKNEADKYAYKPISKVTPPITSLEEYDDYYADYEETPIKKTNRNRKPTESTLIDPIKPSESNKERNKQFTRTKTRTTLDEEDDALTLSHHQKPTIRNNNNNNNNKPENSRGKDRFRSRFQSKSTTEDSLINEQDDKEVAFRNNKPKEYEEEIPQKKIPNNAAPLEDEVVQRRRPYSNTNERKVTTTERAIKNKPIETEYYDEEYEIERTISSEAPRASTSSIVAPRKKWKPTSAISTDTTSTTQRVSTKLTSRTTTTTTTTVAPTSSENYSKERPDQVVRIVKRPFLPSRGGNPYSSRGLQPVGFKAPQKSEVMEPQSSIDIIEHQKSKNIEPINFDEPYSSTRQQQQQQQQSTSRQKYIEPSITYEEPHLVKSKFSEPISEDDNDFKPMIINKPPIHILRPNYEGNQYNGGPRTTQKPKILESNSVPERLSNSGRNPNINGERNPLDINENEYDVTLNDALNPTLPNLPIRSNFPTNGYNPATDYSFNSFQQRQRYVLEPVINPEDADFAYQHQKQQPVVRQRYESIPQSYNSRDQFGSSSNNKNYFAPVSSKRGITQAQTQSFYSTSY